MLIFLFVCLFGTALAKDHPYSTVMVRELQSSFFEGELVSESKIGKHQKRIEKKITELTALFGDPAKAKKSDAILSLSLALKNLEQMKTAEKTEALRLAVIVRDLEGAVRIEGDLPDMARAIEQGGNFLRRWKIPFRSSPEEEATDLYDPASGKFLSPSEFPGKDLSLYDPDPRNPFWRKSGLYDGEDMTFPDEGTAFEFDEVKHSDTKPKINVFVRTADGRKKKFKLKLAAELNGDPTSSQLVRKLGFEADVTKYAKNIRVNLGKKYSLKDLTRDWEMYYRRDNPKMPYKIEDYILEQGRDEKGEFVIFKEGLLEAKPAGVNRVGGWSFSENGHPDLRSLRGLMMIQFWLDNADMKEFGNNQTLIKNDQYYLIISDLGKTFGGLAGDKPELFKDQMVSKRTSTGLTLNFRQYPSNRMKNRITFSDARWAGRLLATLNRDDITLAAKAGGWPQCVENIYVEKLLSRRNDLLHHLGLIGDKDRNGNVITLIPVSPHTDFDLVCDESELEGRTVNYDSNTLQAVRPIVEQAVASLADLASEAVGRRHRLNLSGVEVGVDTGVISQVILSLRRDVEKNPDPKTADEMYLVRDYMEVGLRLGYSFGAFKDVVYTRSFALSYPARTRDEARWKNGFIVNLLLAKDVITGKFPEKYVLQTEHFFEHGAGVEVDDRTQFVSPTAKFRASRARVMRTILDHRNKDQVVIYRDRSKHAELSLRGYLRAGNLKLPLLKTSARWGKSSGAGALLSQKEFSTLNFRKAMIDGDFTDLSPKERSFKVATDFSQTASGYNLFFFRGTNSQRFERVHFEQDKAIESLQYRTTRERSWSFLQGSERRHSTVEVSKGTQSDDYRIRVFHSFEDSNVHDHELEKEYLSFVNAFSPDEKPLIDFTPSLGYTTNKRWGSLDTIAETIYYPEGITVFLKTPEAVLISRIASRFGLSSEKLLAEISKAKELSQELRGAHISQRSSLFRAYDLTNDNFRLYLGVDKFLRDLKSAKAETSVRKRMKKVGSLFLRLPSPEIYGVINGIVGEKNFYTSHLISPPMAKEMNTPEELPLTGEAGRARSDADGYLNFVPETALELYTIFEGWGLAL